MKALVLKIMALSFLVPFGISSLNGQVSVSEILQESNLVQTESNKLYFVDFWATWCGPCVYAKEMLTVLQKQYPKDFYVVSISDESADKVNRYLKKKPSQLAIAVDEEAITFNRFNILSRPNGILFNASGEKLWQGHPSDLKPYLLDRFLNQNSSRKSLRQFVNVIKINNYSEIGYTPKSAIEINNSQKIYENLEVSKVNNHTKLSGKLIDILSYLSKINISKIEIPDDLNKNYDIFIENEELTNKAEQQILKKLKLKFKEVKRKGNVLVLNIDSPKFWDTSQIDWGADNPKYLISDSDIQADNVSLSDIAYELSKSIDLPVVINAKKKSDKHSLHDWQIHYQFFEFMKTSFEEYGITINKETKEYSSYQILKK